MNLLENDGYRLVLKAIVSVKTEEEAHKLLDDLMTRKEMLDMSQRMLVAKMLSEQVVYNKIVEETGASTATISRVNRCYLYGSGGYKSFFEEIKEEKK